MLEAVNSVLSNASYTKAVADQQSVVTSYAANPAAVQKASLQAPYISLYIKVDVNFDKALLQLRDPDTGDVVQQIPSETQLEAYRRAQQVAQRQYQPISERSETSTSEPSSAPPPAVYKPQSQNTQPTPAGTTSVSNTVSAATIAPAVATSAPVSVDTSA